MHELSPRESYLDAHLAAQALVTFIRNRRSRFETEIGWRLFGIQYIRSVGTHRPGVQVLHLSAGERGLLFDLQRASQEQIPVGGTYRDGFHASPFSHYRERRAKSHPPYTRDAQKFQEEAEGVARRP